MPIRIKLTKDENGSIKDIVLNPTTITIEKQVWESTLNRSMVLEAENDKLKELLKECKRQFEEVELCRYDVADTDQEDWFKISTEQASIANEIIIKINQALGEDK